MMQNIYLLLYSEASVASNFVSVWQGPSAKNQNQIVNTIYVHLHIHNM